MGLLKRSGAARESSKPEQRKVASKPGTCPKCNGNGDYFTKEVKPSGGYRECDRCGGSGTVRG